MGLADIFFSSFLIAFTGAMMPGPMVTATMLMSSRKGFASGPLIVMGHGTLEALLVVLLYLGLGSLLKSPAVMGCIGIAGGAMLLWLAYGSFRFTPTEVVAGAGAHAGTRPARTPADGSAYLAGMLTSVSNPYWIIWWATIGLGYIVLSFKYGLTGIAVFYAGHILADLVWFSAVAASFSSMRRLISSKGFRAISVAGGIIFAGFAVYFVWFGIRHLHVR